MLILLTNKCREVCTHCMECSTPDGLDYKPELINPLYRYLRQLDPTHIHISGGEFTLAKDWFEITLHLVQSFPRHIFSFGSNGWWIEDENIRYKIQSLCLEKNVVSVQISTHHKYYPNYNFTKSHELDYKNLDPKIQFMENWQGEGNGSSNLKRLGRAVNLISEDEVKGYPGCAPVLSRAVQADRMGIWGYKDFLTLLVSSGYSCKPCIDLTTGKIMVGESRQCMMFDDLNNYHGATPLKVRSLQNESFRKMKDLKFCDKCKAKKNISQSILDKLGL